MKWKVNELFKHEWIEQYITIISNIINSTQNRQFEELQDRSLVHCKRTASVHETPQHCFTVEGAIQNSKSLGGQIAGGDEEPRVELHILLRQKQDQSRLPTSAQIPVLERW